ncbi:hypothetical protein [Microcoleus vaginatus]|uniref:hypothetical protein n=1 Tax=Microcoleus vaginatus TaxID=119532 RepID=UPI001F61DC82
MSVDVSPLAVNVSGETNAEDPNKNSISISGSAEVPGGFLGVGGGVKINTNTGEVIGGSIGGEIGGLGINVSSSEGDVGVEFTLQIPFTPVEISLGFGFPKKEEPTTPISPTPSIPGIAFSHDQIVPLLEDNKCYHLVILWHTASLAIYTWDIVHKNALKFISQSSPSSPYGGGNWTQQTPLFYASYQEIPYSRTPAFIDYHEPPDPNGSRDPFSANYNKFSANFKAWGVLDGGPQIIISPQSFQYFDRLLAPFMLTGTGDYLKNHIANTRPANQIWDISAYEIPCSRNNTDPTLPKHITPLPPSLAPFPNPPPRRKELDTCCQENLKFLRAIYTKLGLARFPGELPSTIIQEVPNEGEEPAEPLQEPITDLVGLLDWQFRRDDERWGQWEIQINVKDSDLTKEGDQGKSVKFPNLAESVAEMEGQLLSVTTNLDALIAITTKNLVESGLARQEAIKGYLASKSIIKYMAFKSTEIDVTVPSCFTPGAETIHELIAESEIHLKGLDYTEKETLRDILLDLLQAAAVIRAVHWQRIDTKKDTKSQLLGILKGSLDLANSIKNPTKPTDGEEKPNPAQNFEDFLDSAESGFTNTTGITDIQNPYGKTPDRRPRIRQIGDNISQAGDDN